MSCCCRRQDSETTRRSLPSDAFPSSRVSGFGTLKATSLLELTLGSLCGDHNATPTQNPLVDLLTRGRSGLVAFRDEQGSLLPTRLAGKKCIDYGITSGLSSRICCCFDESIIADHRVLAVRIPLESRVTSRGQCTLAKAVDLSPPDEVAQDVWQRLVASTWDALGPFAVPEQADQDALNKPSLGPFLQAT